MVQVAQGHKQVQGGESGYKDTSWWKQAQADTHYHIWHTSNPPWVCKLTWNFVLTYALVPLCLLVPLSLLAPACTLVPTCTIVPSYTHSHPSYPVKLSLLYITHQPPSILPTTPPNKHKWAQARTWADMSRCFSILAACECKKFKQIWLQQVGFECPHHPCLYHSTCIHRITKYHR